jgi:hypothetical protein
VSTRERIRGSRRVAGVQAAREPLATNTSRGGARFAKKTRNCFRGEIAAALGLRDWRPGPLPSKRDDALFRRSVTSSGRFFRAAPIRGADRPTPVMEPFCPGRARFRRRHARLGRGSHAVLPGRAIVLPGRGSCFRGCEVVLRGRAVVFRRGSVVRRRREVVLRRREVVLRRREVVLRRREVVLRRREVVLRRREVVLRRREVVLRRGSVVLRRREVVLRRGSVVFRRRAVVLRRGSVVFRRRAVVLRRGWCPDRTRGPDPRARRRQVLGCRPWPPRARSP